MEYPSRVLIGEDEKGVRRAVRCDSKGYIYPADVSRAVFPLVIDFSKEWHKELINYEELGAEIVDLSAEGIPTPNAWTTKALKFSVGAGETKYLIVNFPGIFSEQQVHILMYLTGDVTAEANTAWTGNHAVLNIQNGWYYIDTRLNVWSLMAIKFTATNGGNVYIAYISTSYNPHTLGYHSYPNQSLDGTTTYTYYVALPVHGRTDGVARVFCHLAGDGTNACNVDVYVLCATDNQWHLIASFSRTSSTISLANIKLAFRMFSEPQNDIQFINIKLEVSGYGLFRDYGLNIWKYDKLCLGFNGLKTASASNVSTTVTKYTLVDNNGRGNRYKQASVVINVPSTGGSATLYINGQQVGSWGAGASVTFNIPEDIDIWKIEVDLAGDGTNPATADFSGLELSGPYIVRR